jgi:hypothetical protein
LQTDSYPISVEIDFPIARFAAFLGFSQNIVEFLFLSYFILQKNEGGEKRVVKMGLLMKRGTARASLFDLRVLKPFSLQLN